MERILGIGGFFFSARDPKALFTSRAPWRKWIGLLSPMPAE